MVFSSSSSSSSNASRASSLSCLAALFQLEEIDISCSEERLGQLHSSDATSSIREGGSSSNGSGGRGGVGSSGSGSSVSRGFGSAGRRINWSHSSGSGSSGAGGSASGSSSGSGEGSSGSCRSGCSQAKDLQHSLTVLSNLTDLTSLRFNRRPCHISDHRVSCSPGPSREWVPQMSKHYCPLGLDYTVHMQHVADYWVEPPPEEVKGPVFDIEAMVLDPDEEIQLMEDRAAAAAAAVAATGGGAAAAAASTAAVTAAVAGGGEGGETAAPGAEAETALAAAAASTGGAAAGGEETAAAGGGKTAAAGARAAATAVAAARAGEAPVPLTPTLASAISQLHQLQHLTWTSCTFSPGQLPQLTSGCSKMESLDISYSSVATVDLACLTMLTGLTSLTAACMEPPLGPDVVPVLLQLIRLVELDVYGNMLGKAGKGLTALKQLQRIDVEENGIGRRGMEALCRVFGDALVVHYVGEEDPVMEQYMQCEACSSSTMTMHDRMQGMKGMKGGRGIVGRPSNPCFDYGHLMEVLGAA